MGCADPVLCYIDSKGKKLYRNFSFVKKHTLLLQSDNLVFNCGKCLFCRKRKSYELACRCVLHASLYNQNCFLTLTYDEKKEGYDNGFHYVHIQRFKKRLRQFVQRSMAQRIEIFNVHEYGKNGKSHWHLVVFNFYPKDAVFSGQRNGIRYFTSEVVTRLWPYGYHSIGEVNQASAMYQSQYMEKDFKYSNVGTSKKSHSRHSGIGRKYFEKHYSQVLRNAFVSVNGKRLPVPRYFEKLAHKHYSHFYEPINFFDTQDRKALYRPFKNGLENKEIADLWLLYKQIKQTKIVELEKQWDDIISHYLTTGLHPDFIKSNDNKLYDLKNKQTVERF